MPDFPPHDEATLAKLREEVLQKLNDADWRATIAWRFGKKPNGKDDFPFKPD